LEVERDGRVLEALLRSLGRLPTAGAEDRDSTEAVLASKAPSAEAAKGAMLGLASLYRRTAQQQRPSTPALEEIGRALRSGSPMVRRAAMAAIVASGRADSTNLHFALSDREREVRRLAALSAFAQPDLAGREQIIEKAWRDSAFAVRYEALRAYARHVAPQAGCGRMLSALDDSNLHVTLLAIDLLGTCGTAGVSRLTVIAREPITPDAWHRPAHALTALARADSTAVAALLPPFVSSPVSWARMYAARAAEAAGITRALRQLARDSVAIVRDAALGGLHRRVGHAADSLYLAALESRDYMVLLTAARALDSSPHPRAVEALGAAFARVTQERRETSRDPRVAMLESIEHIGSAPLATALRAAATDFDTTVAATAARMASRWSANDIEPAPRPAPRQPVPSWSDLTAWNRLTAVITMKGGGVVRMRLRPFDAPTNVARFVRMVRSGWFNGLTWHRVVPNFVVQGGSPGANEYMGDGPFTRDELGLGSHVRGTVGISTRGRDTGDGQLFFNLIDNWRLDHDYTIIGEVLTGMDVVDAWQEGATI
jgi:cyclophilin family peptidyl-prolyl cis-trans isomerase